MKSIRLLVFAVVVLAQLTVPAWAVWMRTQTLSKGKVWKFRTAPVDPVDAVRGRYVALGFAADKVPRADAIPFENRVYAVLKEGRDGFAEIDQLSTTPVEGDNVIEVRPRGWWNGEQRIVFPFDRFWVTEKIAPQAEVAYAESSRQTKENAYVTVRVRKGDAALEQLYIDDQPLVEYLRTHPPK